MFPFLKEIRKAVKCHVGALPIPYRTSEDYPTFFNLPDRSNCAQLLLSGRLKNVG